MTSKIPGAARSEISQAANYNVDANRKHRDVTRTANDKNDGMTKLRREDLGRGSRNRSSK